MRFNQKNYDTRYMYGLSPRNNFDFWLPPPTPSPPLFSNVSIGIYLVCNKMMTRKKNTKKCVLVVLYVFWTDRIFFKPPLMTPLLPCPCPSHTRTLITHHNQILLFGAQTLWIIYYYTNRSLLIRQRVTVYLPAPGLV